MRWYDGRRRLREDRLPVAARGLSRWKLDESLANELTRLGGGIETGTRCDRKVANEGVVDCAGRRASKDRRWVGLKCHLEGFQLESDLEMHMSAGGYVGLSRIEGRAGESVRAFSPRGAEARWRSALRLRLPRALRFRAAAGALAGGETGRGERCSVAALGYGSPVSAPGSLGAWGMPGG